MKQKLNLRASSFCSFQMFLVSVTITTRLISKEIVVGVVVVIGVGVVVVHVVAVVIPVADTRNIHNKVWLKPGY